MTEAALPEDHFPVAPFAGAWIEILLFGGKLFVAVVAPFAGAWIEIDDNQRKRDCSGVAPFAGAWIEIFTLRPTYSE